MHVAPTLPYIYNKFMVHKSYGYECLREMPPIPEGVPGVVD